MPRGRSGMSLVASTSRCSQPAFSRSVRYFRSPLEQPKLWRTALTTAGSRPLAAAVGAAAAALPATAGAGKAAPPGPDAGASGTGGCETAGAAVTAADRDGGTWVRGGAGVAAGVATGRGLAWARV